MMTSSNGNIFRVTGSWCGEFTGHRRIPLTKNSGAELCCSFDLRLNKRLSKQPCGWWSETPSPSLWRHCNEWNWDIPVNLCQYHGGRWTGDDWDIFCSSHGFGFVHGSLSPWRRFSNTRPISVLKNKKCKYVFIFLRIDPVRLWLITFFVS